MPSERKKKTRTREIEMRTTTTTCDSSESDAEWPKCGLAYKSVDCDGSVVIVVTTGIIYDVHTDVCGAKIPAKFTCTDCK